MTQMGLWDSLIPFGCAVHAMHLGAGHSVPQALGQSMTLNREDAGQDSLAWIVENHALLSALRRRWPLIWPLVHWHFMAARAWLMLT